MNLGRGLIWNPKYLIVSVFFVALYSLIGCATFGSHDEYEDPIAKLAEFYNPPSEALEEQLEAKALQSAWIQQAMVHNDLAMGMNMDEVRAIWGDPREIETAGISTYGNQRWIYYQGLSSPWSLSSARIIYFEKGQVIGWETAER